MFSIYDGRDNFYQWDKGTKLIVYDESITEVHFANCLCSNARRCEVYSDGPVRVVDVPDVLLTETYDIRVWGFDGNSTKHCQSFEVEKKTKPDNYIYTPEEQQTWEVLTAKVESMEEYMSAMMEAMAYFNERITALEEGKPIIYFTIDAEQYHTISGTTWRQYLADANHKIVKTTCQTCKQSTDFKEVHNELDDMPYISIQCTFCHDRFAYRITDAVAGEYVFMDDVIRETNYDLMEA